MNDPLPNDPALESLAARLAACAPRVGPERSQALLYECAYSAGQSAANRRTRRWQGLAAALGVLVAALSIPLINRRSDEVALQQPTAPVDQSAIAVEQSTIPRALAPATSADAEVTLSAWQQPAKPSDDLEAELARYEATDPALRSLAVAHLSRAILE